MLTVGYGSPRSHKQGEVLYENKDPLFLSKSASRIKYTRAQTVPPPAREAAFHGPPRFDWIDIETAAATKIQAATRRFIVMNTMEAEGIRTSAIRNRRRRRKAAQRNNPNGNKAVSSEDAPSFMACCGAGLAFGDATEMDENAYRAFQRQQYEERIKEQVEHEAALRTRYLRSHGGGHLVEEIEVVD